MTTGQIILLVAIFIAMDTAVVGAVFTMAGQSIAPLAAKFPARPPAPDAVRRNFQSFRFDSVNLGMSIHVAADPDHLHLYPSWIARRIRMKPVSIPWEAIAPDESPRRRGSSMRVRIGHMRVLGPRWCLALADRPASDGV